MKVTLPTRFLNIAKLASVDQMRMNLNNVYINAAGPVELYATTGKLALHVKWNNFQEMESLDYKHLLNSRDLLSVLAVTKKLSAITLEASTLGGAFVHEAPAVPIRTMPIDMFPLQFFTTIQDWPEESNHFRYNATDTVRILTVAELLKANKKDVVQVTHSELYNPNENAQTRVLKLSWRCDEFEAVAYSTAMIQSIREFNEQLAMANVE